MIMGKKSLHLYHHFGNKTIFMQATNTYTIKTNITPATHQCIRQGETDSFKGTHVKASITVKVRLGQDLLEQ